MQGIVGSSLLKSSPFGISHFIKSASVAGQSSFDISLAGSIQVGGVRWRHSKRVNVKVQRQVSGGVQYPGFTHFPRHADQKDPPIEPSKLFLVKRIRSTFGCPWWEKEWVEQFKLGSRAATAIVKNTPRNNAMLYKIKHLVEITPITTPFGMPDDPKHAFVKENGEFIAYNCIEGHQLQLEEAEVKVDELKKKNVDGETLKNRLRHRWYSRW